jgi:ABC-type multidrug transport system ATPase subunit
MMLENSDAPAVEMVGVTRRFGACTAVDNMNMTIPRGTTLGLIGPNGAGKSTAIRMLMGTLAPTSGEVRLFGMNVAKHAATTRHHVGYVPERHDVYPWMTVAEVVRFTASFYPKWDARYCEEMLDMFTLDVRKKVRHLSKGMTVKLGLLLAVSHRPELLVLDEPTSGLDPIVHDDFLEAVLHSISGRGTTVLYSSHNLEDVRRLADSVCILRGGKILVHGRVDELLASVKRVRAVLTDGHLPRWVPDETVSQRINRREWLLTVSRFSDDVEERLKAENPIETVEVYDLNLGELFKDYILEGGAR